MCHFGSLLLACVDDAPFRPVGGGESYLKRKTNSDIGRGVVAPHSPLLATDLLRGNAGSGRLRTLLQKIRYIGLAAEEWFVSLGPPAPPTTRRPANDDEANATQPLIRCKSSPLYAKAASGGGMPVADAALGRDGLRPQRPVIAIKQHLTTLAWP